MTKKVSTLPISLTDLGSTALASFNFTEAKLYDRMRPETYNLAKAVPVYLVSKTQIDEIYPPQKRRAFNDPECIRAASEEFERIWQERYAKQFDNDPDRKRALWWEHILSRCGGSMVYVAMGLYIPKGDTVNASFLSSPIQGPAIFLCLERIANHAAQNNVPNQLGLAKVYYHELAHAELDTGSTEYHKHWVRVIEESLCNALTLTHFTSTTEARKVQRLMESQPLEYRGYRYIWQPFQNSSRRGWEGLFPFFPFAHPEIWRRLAHDPDLWWHWPHWWGGTIARLLHDYHQRRLSRQDAHKYLSDFLHDYGDWSRSEAEKIANQILSGTFSPFLTFIEEEVPLPFRHVAPRKLWQAYKAARPQKGYDKPFWEELAQAILLKLSE